MHVNAVMFQTRPAADALYQSTIEPWSKYDRFNYTSLQFSALNIQTNNTQIL